MNCLVCNYSLEIPSRKGRQEFQNNKFTPGFPIPRLLKSVLTDYECSNCGTKQRVAHNQVTLPTKPNAPKNFPEPPKET